MKRGLFASLVLALLPVAVLAQAPPPYTAAILIEPVTGRVLFEKNARTPLPVASMTKMTTLLVTLDALKDGSITLDTPVTISARASKMGGSQVYAKQGAVFPVRALMAATMVHSANDAAMALAEKVAGSAEAMAQMMNAKVQEMGLKESTFYTPHGLPDEGTADDVMSAHDAARVGIELMKNPLMRELAVQQTMPFQSGTFTTMYNPNHLLRTFPGATGIKTGFHNKAGFCVTGSARRNNMDLVVVIMGSKNKKDNFGSAAAIMNDGFINWRQTSVVKKGIRAKDLATIKGGKAPAVPVTAAADAVMLLARGEQANMKTTVETSNVAAPIVKGQPVGFIVVKQNGKQIAKVPALAAINVDKQPWWKSFLPF